MPAANNDFASAITISGSSGTISPDADLQTSNTTETGEINATDIKQTVWYTWTAPSSGKVQFSISPTLSSGRYGFLAVHTGSAVNALTQVDGTFAAHGSTVPLSFNVVSGTTYKIQVGVYLTPSVAGTAAISWDYLSAPANDDFANAVVLSGLPDSDGPVDMTAATVEGSEPTPTDVLTPQATIWYKWTAPSNGTVLVDITTDGDGWIATGVYTGTTLAGLTEVASSTSSDDSCHFTASSGTDYYIQVVNMNDSDFTEVTINLSSITLPPNDDFDDAIELVGHRGDIDGTTLFGSTDFPADEYFNGGANVWYKWTAVADGPVTFDTFLKPDEPGNINDTTLTVYTGTDFSDLTRVVENDDEYDPVSEIGVRSKVTFTAVEGTDYWIEVAALSTSGEDGEFTLRWVGVRPPYTTPLRTEWVVGVYDKSANGKDSTSFDGSVTDEYLKHGSNYRLTYTLNGIDQLQFDLLLDDPAALNITKKTTIIRVWRFINDVENSKVRGPEWATPDFCGVVTAISKDGEAGTMTVTCQSVLWLVQVHFHLLNHRLVNDPEEDDVPAYREGSNMTGLQWDHSALMFHLIDLINGAWKYSGGDTGIRRPPTADYSGTGYMSGYDLYWPQTVAVPPFYVQKGAYTWPLLYDDLLSRDASPDIIPEYIYNPGSIDVMYFKTGITRGSDFSETVSFDYKTGQKNIENVTEESQVVPGEYANYVWISGDGGPNGGLLWTADDSADITSNGIFMKHDNVPGTKLADVQDLASATIKSSAQADSEIYTVTMSPAAPLYYDLDYSLGDMVALNADKGALQVENKPQRIYQVTLGWSDNNVETTEVMISNDFKRKFV